MPSIIPSSHIPSSAWVWMYFRDCEHYLGRITSFVAHATLFILLIRFFILEPGLTDGISMTPTIRDNTPLLIEKISLLARPPQRGDIIQHLDPNDRHTIFVKRIVGLPGETVTVKQNAIHITKPDGTEYRLDERYLPQNIIISVPIDAQNRFSLAPAEYFVLGDNRANSRDSRNYGPVHRKFITGKVYSIALH